MFTKLLRLTLVEKEMTAKDILSKKASMWNYEEETRFLKTVQNSNRPMLRVNISRIFIGCKVDLSKFSFLCKLINKIDPHIKLIKMKKDWLDYGYKSTN